MVVEWFLFRRKACYALRLNNPVWDGVTGFHEWNFGVFDLVYGVHSTHHIADLCKAFRFEETGCNGASVAALAQDCDRSVRRQILELPR